MKDYRCCVSCRKIAPKTNFWRVVRLYPSHAIQLDQGMGRSAYLCRDAACLQAAQKKNRLGRSLKAPVPEAVYQTLWQRLSASDFLPAPCFADTARVASPAVPLEEPPPSVDL